MISVFRNCVLIAAGTSAVFIGATLAPSAAKYILCCVFGTAGFVGAFFAPTFRRSSSVLPMAGALVAVVLASAVGAAIAVLAFFLLLHPRPEAVFQAQILAGVGGIVTVMGAGVGLLAALWRHRDQVKRFFDEKVLEPDALIVIDGRFTIERMVEQGGMGVVYRAIDRTTRAPVALKLLLRRGDDSPSGERFAREVRILAGLEHPRIARYVAHGQAANRQAYLAMQWLDGEDLRATLTRGPLSLADSLQVLAGAAEGLAAVHAQGIVHRDLKPGNLFLRGGSAADLMLLDFGLARDIDSNSQLTHTAAIMGTPQYMAPEQASSSPHIQPATDIFALGCIFYECLTGRHAFGGAQMVGVLARILFDNPEPVRELRRSVPQAWSDLLGRMLSKHPAERPRDAVALLEEIRRLPPATAGSEVSIASELPQTAADQILVSVVLAAVPVAWSGSDRPDSASGFEAVRTAMSKFNCPIERLVDGSVLATISPTHTATDQARIAARCALSLRDLWPRARIAVTTGRGPANRSSRVGEAVDRAARLVESPGRWEGIRIDALTAGLLDARFSTATHDGEVVLLAEQDDLDESRPLLGKPTPCVGRDVELSQLEALLSTAVEEALPKTAVILGTPGIGKSRLRQELLRRTQVKYPATQILVGYGDPLNAGSPYVIVSDALRRHAGIRLGDEPAKARASVLERLGRHVDPAQRRRVCEFLGELCGIPFPGEDSPPLRAARSDDRVMSEQIALAFLDWLNAECAVHPMLLVLEDVQWGDALTVKLLESTLRDLKEGSLLVLALGRPEVEELFPRLLSGHRAFSLSLHPLSDKASELLVRGVLGDIGEESLARVVQMAAGNALFLEELIRAAVEGQAGDVPATVVAMLQARLSRLPPEARQVLRAGSIFGERFWRGAVMRVCEQWGPIADTDAALAHLVEAELVEKRRKSRFPGDVEYALRHQLVCEAANGLSTEADLRSGHQAGGQWLEECGEPDGIVLARHAQEGGDLGRAIAFYVRAAEQSIAQHDFGEALARASSGIACGAQGEPLGILRSVQSSALYSMARWVESAEVGLSALPLLPAGGLWWCVTIEKLLQVLPNVGQLERCQELADEMLRTPPLADARDAYLRALHVQLLGYAVSASHARGQSCLAFIDKVGGDIKDQDIVARGYGRLWRAIFTFITGTDLCLALSLAEDAERDLAESQVMYRLSLAYLIQAFIWWGLGDFEKSERAARRGGVVAGEIRDDYHSALAAWYLGLALCEQSEAAKLAEAEACAMAVMNAHVSPLYDGPLPRVITARVAVTRGDWPRAEADGRTVRDGLMAMAPYGLIGSADLLRALVSRGLFVEAAAIARDDLAVIKTIGGPICSEVLFKVAAAEAFYRSGDRDTGKTVLADALGQIELRASKITDPALRDSYLGRREENRRAIALREQWG